MKKLLIVLLAFGSLSTFASEFTIEERAKLYTVKMMLEMQLESVKEVTVIAQKNLVAYRDLSRFALSEKRQLRAKNCGDIKSVIGANMLMVMSAMEQAKEALSKVEVSDENGLTFQENYLEYIKKAREASNQCKDVERSAEAIEAASTNLETASKILIEALPELIQE